jgi:hypothetical protein
MRDQVKRELTKIFEKVDSSDDYGSNVMFSVRHRLVDGESSGAGSQVVKIRE